MESFNGYIQPVNIPARAWDLRFVSESSSGIGGGFGSSPNQDKAQTSYSQFRRDRTTDPDRCAIVVVEDNVGDVFLVKEAIAAAKLGVDVYFLTDGLEVLQFFALIEEGGMPCPQLLLLDLNIPRANGFQVLSYLRNSKVGRPN